MLVQKWSCSKVGLTPVRFSSTINCKGESGDICDIFATGQVHGRSLIQIPGGGGNTTIYHWKIVRVCAPVMTPFFQASRHSLVYQFPINGPLMCPTFSNSSKICIFRLVFGQNCSSQEAKFQNFRSQDPSFFKENLLPRPYFWKPTHTHQKKLSPPLQIIFLNKM